MGSEYKMLTNNEPESQWKQIHTLSEQNKKEKSIKAHKTQNKKILLNQIWKTGK